jgi:hypothetical protein
MILSMDSDYISELLPTAGLSFIPQLIHEHEEPWLNDVDRGKILIRPPELSGNPTSKVIW